MCIENALKYTGFSEIHHAWASFAFVFVLFIVGCTGSTPNAFSMPNTKTYLGYATEAAERGDWVAAYRLLEDVLVAEDHALRLEAENLVAEYPQIRSGAFESFSKESLKNTYLAHGEQAWLIEEERLSIYQTTLATPEQAANAWFNYQEVYGDRIAKSQIAKNIHKEAMEERRRSNSVFEKEIRLALLSGVPVRTGRMQDLLKGMVVGQTLRKQVLARLGRPSRTFESHTILTWAVRVGDKDYSILGDFVRSKGGVTHSLVMTFDNSLILDDMAMVRVIK